MKSALRPVRGAGNGRCCLADGRLFADEGAETRLIGRAVAGFRPQFLSAEQSLRREAASSRSAAGRRAPCAIPTVEIPIRDPGGHDVIGVRRTSGSSVRTIAARIAPLTRCPARPASPSRRISIDCWTAEIGRGDEAGEVGIEHATDAGEERAEDKARTFCRVG